MGIDLDTFDIKDTNILLNGINAPLINKNKPFYQSFKIYYYHNVAKIEKGIKSASNTIDTDSQTLAILYNRFTNIHMQGTEIVASALQAAILGKTNNPLEAENLD